MAFIFTVKVAELGNRILCTGGRTTRIRRSGTRLKRTVRWLRGPEKGAFW
jgi:hypothetical protein